MRVALLAPLACAAIVGTTTAASACSLDSAGSGTVSHVIATVSSLLGIKTAPAATHASTPASTANTFDASNSTSNDPTTPAAPMATSFASATLAPGPTITLAATRGASGGGGGGGGGFSGVAFGGHGGGGGTLYNPSSDAVSSLGTHGTSDSQADVALTASTTGIGFAGAASGEVNASTMTAGVVIASVPTGKAGETEAWPVGMASAATDAAVSDSAVGFERIASMTLPSTRSGWTLLAGLLGVGAMGTSWVLRALVV